MMAQYAHITVGQMQGDIVGNDQRALQAAVDYIAGLGQGTVEIGPGVYTMWDSLHLRSGVHVRGAGEDTVLRKGEGASSPLVLDGDYGEEQITLANPAGFDVGRGMMVVDEKAGGFHVTVTRIIARDGDTMVIAAPLLADYMVAQKAMAHLQFPVISGYYVHDADRRGLDPSTVTSPTMCRSPGAAGLGSFYIVAMARRSVARW